MYLERYTGPSPTQITLFRSISPSIPPPSLAIPTMPARPLTVNPDPLVRNWSAIREQHLAETSEKKIQDYGITFTECDEFPLRLRLPNEIPLDEQACRDFLVYELGEEERLPCLLTYEDGIQEISSRLIARFGDEKIGQAMRIMFDLIENKHNATGVGDEGDRFAPWRHDHFHRHDDWSNPGTPHFPNFVLPPTPRATSLTLPTNRKYYQMEAFVKDWGDDCVGNSRERIRAEVPLRPNAGSPMGSLTDQETKDQTKVGTDHNKIVASSHTTLPSTYYSRDMVQPSSDDYCFPLQDQNEAKQLPGHSSFNGRNDHSRRRQQTVNGDTLVKSENRSFSLSALSDTLGRIKSDNGKGRDTQFVNARTILSHDRINRNLGKLKRNFTRKQAVARATNPPGQSNFSDNLQMSGGLHFDGSADVDDFEPYEELPPYSKEQVSTDTEYGTALQQPLTEVGHDPDLVVVGNGCHGDLPIYHPSPAVVVLPAGESWHKVSPELHRPFESDTHQQKDSLVQSALLQISMASVGERDSPEPSVMTSQNHFDEGDPTYREQLETRATRLPTNNPPMSCNEINKTVSEDGIESNGNVSDQSIQDRDLPQQRDTVGPEIEAKRTTYRYIYIDNTFGQQYRSLDNFTEAATTSILALGRKAKHLMKAVVRNPDIYTCDVQPMLDGIQATGTTGQGHSMHQDSDTGYTGSNFAISVSPPEQASFYNTLEFLIADQTNKFLWKQRDCIDPLTLKSVVADWQNKCHPQVTCFRFDTCTQLEIVALNQDSLKFCGINRTTVQARTSVILAWRSLTREITCRTYCHGDSAIKKHIVDAQKVLALIGTDAQAMEEFQGKQTLVLAAIAKAMAYEQDVAGIPSTGRAWSPSRFTTTTIEQSEEVKKIND